MDAAAELRGHRPSLILQAPSIIPVHHGVFAVVRCSFSPEVANCYRPQAAADALCRRGRSLVGGQATYGLLGPSRAVPWMFMDPLVLVLPFSVTAGPPPASPLAIHCSLLVGIRERPHAKIRAKEGA